MFVEILVVAEFCHGLMRDFNNLQNEEVIADLDEARDKATEVLKRLLHTQKVRHDIQHIIPYPVQYDMCHCVTFSMGWQFVVISE
jgi:hypothetical protein